MITRQIFKVIRLIHTIFFQKQLPTKIAIYFHNVKNDELKKFEDLLDFFQNNKYNFCDPNEYINARGKSLFISFDDNHFDWLKIGELLAKRGIRGTFYINTGPIRDCSTSQYIKEYFNRIKYSEGEKTLSSEDIKLLNKKYNQCIGNHTVNHYNLAELDLSQAKAEIKISKNHLEQIIGSEIKHFSYPFGMRRFFSNVLKEYCIELGFDTVSNAIPGLLHKEIQKYDISRTMWDLNKSFGYNLTNLKIDGSLFETITGKSSISFK